MEVSYALENPLLDSSLLPSIASRFSALPGPILPHSGGIVLELCLNCAWSVFKHNYFVTCVSLRSLVQKFELCLECLAGFEEEKLNPVDCPSLFLREREKNPVEIFRSFREGKACKIQGSSSTNPTGKREPLAVAQFAPSRHFLTPGG
jgi:hypothetical protein